MDVAERWTSTVVLGDGSSAVIRPITPADAPALAAFHLSQSAESRYYRFFSPKPDLSAAELERFTTVDFVDRVAFVIEERGEFIAWASYERWNNRDDAEVAFQVDDGHRGKGIATLLLEHLAAVARSNGIERFTAQTLGDNRSMLTVFAKAGWPLHRRFESGVIDVDFALADTSDFIDSVERREQRADSRAMARVLLPTSIAVIGASDEPASVGRALWQLVSADRRRPTYAVNARHRTIDGVDAYATVTDVPDDVSLAIVSVPASALAEVLQQCIDKRVRGAVVMTTVAGTVVDTPIDTRIDTPLDTAAIVAHARRSGLRIIGPGSMGIASPRDDVALQASLAEVELTPGNVAISMQSGTLGIGLLRLAAQLQLPISWFVSLGDKADVSGNDLLQFWEDDEATQVIAIYTESLGNPRKFARIARRVSRSRPIVAVRTGAALIGAGNEALYRDTGVIEVPTVTAMLDTARVLATQPLLAGRRVAVVTNSTSPGVLARATLEAVGLEPVDPPRQLSWRSTPDDYRSAVRGALHDRSVDAVLVIHAPPLIDAIGEASAQIDAACEGASKPVVAVLLGSGDGPILPGSSVPSFSFPEQAAAVLGRIAAYADWRRTEGAVDLEPDQSPDHIDIAGAGAIIAASMLTAGSSATPETIHDLLACYGVEMPPTRSVDSPSAADVAAIAAEIGFPVAVKAARRRVGRTAEAGVALDLTDTADVEQAVTTMREHLGGDAATVVVQRMTSPGVDIRIRVRDDERLGPVITVGLGGVQADAIGDESSRLAPVSPSTAMSMIADTRAVTALTPATHERLADVVARIALLASDHPAIAELDLNPVVVNADGCCVVDALVTLRDSVRAEPAVRRLE